MNKTTFDIFIIKKVPVLTNVLIVASAISALIFISLYGLLGGDDTTPETKAFFLIETRTINLLYGSGIMAVMLTLTTILLRLKSKGALSFHKDAFEIRDRSKSQLLPYSAIKQVYCTDPESPSKIYSKNLRCSFQTAENTKFTFALRNLDDTQSFLDNLLAIEQLKIDHMQWIG